METDIQAILCGGNQKNKNRNNNLEINQKREETNNTFERHTERENHKRTIIQKDNRTIIQKVTNRDYFQK